MFNAGVMTNTTTPPTGGYRDMNRLMSLMTGDEKHGPAATSTLDALWVLYDRVLRVTPGTVDAPDRDRFLLSKGHGPMAYYAVLAAHGFFGEELLSGFGAYDSRSGTTRTGPWCRGSRSAAGRWDTGCRWPWGPRSVCGRGG